MTLGEALRKNAPMLLSGFISGIILLFIVRQTAGEPLIQPQADFGILIGAALVTGFVVFKDMRAPNGKHQS